MNGNFGRDRESANLRKGETYGLTESVARKGVGGRRIKKRRHKAFIEECAESQQKQMPKCRGGKCKLKDVRCSGGEGLSA